MNYYQLNRDRFLKKANDRYHNGGGKEKSAECYRKNQEVLRENARNKYRDLPEEEKGSKKILWKR